VLGFFHIVVGGGALATVQCTATTGPSLDFGNVPVGQFVTRDVVMSDNFCGSVPDLVCISPSCSDFSTTPPDCFTPNHSLPWQGVTFHLTFAPTSTGVQTCNYVISETWNGSTCGGSKSICCVGTGVPASPGK